MRIKKICALVIAACSAASISAQAFGGTYPVHPSVAPGVKEVENSVMNCWTESNADYVFEVGGKKFVLLDTDEEGNYLVLAENEYGKRAYSTSYAGSQLIESRVNGEYIAGAAHDMVYDNWKFDTENETSIGYWLNHDFLENGNGSFKLPEEIKAALVEKDWQVEGYKPVVSWTADTYYENPNGTKHAPEFAQSCVEEGYTVRGKVSLMSYTEYKQYQSVIGWMYCAAGWDGFMLRTPHSLITASNATELRYKFGSVQVKNQSSNVDTSKKMLIAGNDTPDKANFYVRPIMWLNKDFFVNTAVNAQTVGNLVKGIITENSLGELSLIYSDEELEALGLDLSNAPSAKNLSVAGTPAEGAVLYAKYDFVSPSGSNELNSEIEWYISDKADGEYSPINAQGRFIITDSSMNGKYLKYRIMPCEASGGQGKYFWSETLPAVELKNIPVVSNVDITDSEVTLKIKNNSSEENDVKIIKAVYDSSNQLISVSDTDITAMTPGAESEKKISIEEKKNGCGINVMVWIGKSQPVFYVNL